MPMSTCRRRILSRSCTERHSASIPAALWAPSKQDERRIDNALQTACDTRTRQTAHSGLDRNVPAAQTQGINRAERVEAF